VEQKVELTNSNCCSTYLVAVSTIW